MLMGSRNLVLPTKARSPKVKILTRLCPLCCFYLEELNFSIRGLCSVWYVFVFLDIFSFD